MAFKHITFQQRVQLETMVKEKRSRSYMAYFLGVSVRTVYYELQRGKVQQMRSTLETYWTYSSETAQRVYEQNQSYKGKAIKLGKNWSLVEFLEEYIGRRKYSPRAALAEIERQGLDFGLSVSHATLYSWIYRGYFLHLNSKSLPEGKRQKKAKTVLRVNYCHSMDKIIEKRPADVAERETVGHWEMDTVQGVRNGKQSCLLVLTERKTKIELVYKMRGKTASETVRILNELQRKFGRDFSRIFQTITCDNGNEFADTKGIEKANRTQVFYCHPFSSWERGQNENANKMIRRFVPKGQTINKFTKSQIAHVQHWMNNYPRKMLNWRTPFEVFREEMAAFGVPPSVVERFA